MGRIFQYLKNRPHHRRSMKMKVACNIALLASTALLCKNAAAQIPPPMPPPGVAFPGPVGTPMPPPMAPPSNSAAAQKADNPNNPLANSPADKLEKATKDLKDALKLNPFFQLAGVSMEIRELAMANPAALKGVGVFVVDLPESSESDDVKKDNSEQGLLDIASGKSTPCAKIAREEIQTAQKELGEFTSPENQEDLEKTMTPQQRIQYNQRRISQIKNEISIEKKKIERAKKQIRKNAERREQ